MSYQKLPISIRQARGEMPAPPNATKSSGQAKEAKSKAEFITGEALDESRKAVPDSKNSQSSSSEGEEELKPFFVPSFRSNNPNEVLNPELESEQGKIPAQNYVAAKNPDRNLGKSNAMSDDEARDEFVQAVTTAANDWAEDVLERWFRLNDRRPNEFLKVFGWVDGPKLALNAVPASSPGAGMIWTGKSNEHVAALKNVPRYPPQWLCLNVECTGKEDSLS